MGDGMEMDGMGAYLKYAPPLENHPENMYMDEGRDLGDRERNHSRRHDRAELI